MIIPSATEARTLYSFQNDGISTERCTITMDAMGTQKNIVNKIVEKKDIIV